jgi:hypothetical protein
MAREISHPFLIARDDAGQFRLTVRDTRYNSQGFALFTARLQDECFRTAAEARAFARDNFGAQPGQFTSK